MNPPSLKDKTLREKRPKSLETSTWNFIHFICVYDSRFPSLSPSHRPPWVHESYPHLFFFIFFLVHKWFYILIFVNPRKQT